MAVASNPALFMPCADASKTAEGYHTLMQSFIDQYYALLSDVQSLNPYVNQSVLEKAFGEWNPEAARGVSSWAKKQASGVRSLLKYIRAKAWKQRDGSRMSKNLKIRVEQFARMQSEHSLPKRGLLAKRRLKRIASSPRPVPRVVLPTTGKIQQFNIKESRGHVAKKLTPLEASKMKVVAMFSVALEVEEIASSQAEGWSTPYYDAHLKCIAGHVRGGGVEKAVTHDAVVLNLV